MQLSTVASRTPSFAKAFLPASGAGLSFFMMMGVIALTNVSTAMMA